MYLPLALLIPHVLITTLKVIETVKINEKNMVYLRPSS